MHNRTHTRAAARSRVLGALIGVGALAAALLSAPAASAATSADTADAAGEAKTVVYVEVNNNDFKNVADYTLEGTTRPAFDIGIIFAANINYDPASGAYLHLNERVTATLEDAANQVRPVQARGTKVLLSVLGNHQGAGFANFTSYEQADAFAAQLEDVVETYGLDGIDFDDEYSNYGANGTAQPNAQSFGWLVTALRDRLGPDKLITLYAIGPTYDDTNFSLFDSAGTIDYAWNPYYPTYNAPTVAGLEDRSRLGAAAVDLSANAASVAADFAAWTVRDGYGVYVTYNLTATDQSAYLSGITGPLKGLRTVYRAPAPDTTRPTTELISPTTATPQRGPSIEIRAADAGGLDRIVGNIYQQGKLVASTSTSPRGATEATHAATPKLADGTYELRYNSRDVAGNVSRTATQTFVVDNTRPTVTVKTGAGFTAGSDGTYSQVSFKLFDAAKVDRVFVNGVEKDLSNNTWSDLNFVRPGTFGAAEGANELLVLDVAGNVTTVSFILTQP